MIRILIVECMQEISSFNPRQSTIQDFKLLCGGDLLGRRGSNSYLGGALAAFDEAGVEVVPTISATAPSAGVLEAASWDRLRRAILAAVEADKSGIDGIYFSLHGAMGAENEHDPEGALLEAVRVMVGPHVPIVISLDLHGIYTAKMMRQVDGFAALKTYPHVDFADTGARAARLLLEIVEKKLKPCQLRATIPAIVRGDELVTKTGCFGDRLREVTRLEREGAILSGGIFIGNPFTDVPELQCQVVLCTAGDPTPLAPVAQRLAQDFWRDRARMQGKLITVEAAIAQARSMDGPVVFTDAADATSSGATGDSNHILKALLDAGYERRVLLPVVDPTAAAACHATGCGNDVTVRLGGTQDPGRFTPIELSGVVESLSRGKARLETMKVEIDAGPTAVLTAQNITVMIMSEPAFLFDRSLFYANGLDPADFDLVVVKSPHCEPHMFDDACVKNFNIDAPGSTSANLPTLGHKICRRPLYPLDEVAMFEPEVEIIERA